MSLRRVSNPSRTGFIKRRLKSWNIEYNFKWNQHPIWELRLKFKPRIKFFKFALKTTELKE